MVAPLKKKMLRVFIVVVVILGLPITNSYADVRAFLNQDNAYVGDPVRLTIETDGSANQPDLTPLNKDFDILGTSTSSQIRIINGQRSSKKSWIVSLQPKRKGKIDIPAITLGAEKTAPVALTVSDIPPQVKAQTQEHVFVEASVELDNGKPYVQQQIPYTVKLFYDDQLMDYKMFPPTLDNAVIEQIQQKDKYRVSRNGKNFMVIERNFVISPEKSGHLTIPPMIIKGSLKRPRAANQPANGGGNVFQNDPFFNDPFGGSIFSNSIFQEPGKPITLRTEPIELEIRPLAKEFTGDDWLPAKDLVIVDSWEKQPPTLRVGEPVTRTLSLQAEGLASSQIPKLELPSLNKARIYTDQEKLETFTNGSTVIGVSKQTITYIPSAEGELIIPEIKMDWWNIESEKQETFTLPGMKLNILPGVAGSIAKPSTGEEANTPEEEIDTENKEATTEVASENTLSPWLIMAALLALAGGVFFVLKSKGLLKRKRKAVDDNLSIDKKPVHMSEKAVLSTLQQACEANNQQQAAQSLLQLVQLQWTDSPPQNLGALAKALSIGEKVVRQLDKSLYAGQGNHWKGEKLGQLVEQGLQRKVSLRTHAKDGLNDLYPAWENK